MTSGRVSWCAQEPDSCFADLGTMEAEVPGEVTFALGCSPPFSSVVSPSHSVCLKADLCLVRYAW